MRSLVTGGAGFIGSHLAERLLEMGPVDVIDNLSGGWEDNVPDGATLTVLDLCEREKVRKVYDSIKPDLVFHFAAYAAQGLSPWAREHAYRNNLVASGNLLNAAIETGCDRFVFASSMGVYGEGHPPFSESSPLRPIDPYSIAKYAFERDLVASSALHGIEFTIIRPHNVYGERQNLGDPYRNVIAIFIRQALLGLPLTVFNDGLQTRAYTYVGDIIDPIIRAATTPQGVHQAFNIGGDTPYTILDLIEGIEEVWGKPLPVTFSGDRPEAHHAYCDHSKARTRLAFLPTTPLQEGLTRMVEWAIHTEIRWSRAPIIELTRGFPTIWE